MWDLPGPGLEPVSPALAGGFLTTAPPGKPPMVIFDWMSDIVNFTLLSDGYFCGPINFLELCSRVQLSNLETV